MILRPLALFASALLLAACGGGGSTARKVDQATTVVSSSGGPNVVANAQMEKEPVIAPPAANQTLFKVRVHDRKSGNPIANARVILLRNAPEPLYMREPPRRDVIYDTKTRGTGLFYALADADGAMKYALVTGQGFIPTLVEAGPATGGQTHEVRVDADLVPTFKCTIRSPNGDRAGNALCTMKPDVDVTSNRPGLKANYGWSERADDLGVVTFNREPGVYRLEFSDENGKHRWYERYTWSGTQDKPREITLPEQSQDKPW